MKRIVGTSLLLLFSCLPALSQTKRASTPQRAARASASPTALLESARQSSARGDYTAAITSLRTALDAAPNSTELLYEYGQVAARLDKPAETIRVMSAATRLESDNADYLYLLGVAQLWTGDTENATVPLARASELSPDSVRTHLALGAALHALTQDDKAVDPLKRALALDPTNSEASYLMADICQTKGDLATAERLVDSVLSRNPKHAGANLVRGVVLFKKGDPEGSRKALELAATSDPGDPRVYSQLSRVYTQLGDPAKAAEAEHNFQTANRRSKQSNHELRQLLEFATPATGKK